MVEAAGIKHRCAAGGRAARRVQVGILRGCRPRPESTKELPARVLIHDAAPRQ